MNLILQINEFNEIDSVLIMQRKYVNICVKIICCNFPS